MRNHVHVGEPAEWDFVFHIRHHRVVIPVVHRVFLSITETEGGRESVALSATTN